MYIVVKVHYLVQLVERGPGVMRVVPVQQVEVYMLYPDNTAIVDLERLMGLYNDVPGVTATAWWDIDAPGVYMELVLTIEALPSRAEIQNALENDPLDGMRVNGLPGRTVSVLP